MNPVVTKINTQCGDVPSYGRVPCQIPYPEFFVNQYVSVILGTPEQNPTKIN